MALTSVVRVPLLESDPLATAAMATIAYQPIIGTSSLRSHGFEALTRLPATSAYPDVLRLLDAAAAAGKLLVVERELLAQSITGFARFAGASESRLFCNVDNRVFDADHGMSEYIVELARSSGLQPANICIELSERQAPSSIETLARLVDIFLQHNVRIAIDDFGQGFSGLNMLMRIDPHYLKIDQAFIEGIAHSPRKQAIVSKVAALAHSLGQLVVAEGVETESDFRTARELGCDLAQGFLICRPDTALVNLRTSYPHAVTGQSEEPVIPIFVKELMQSLEPLRLDELVSDAVDRFKRSPVRSFLPVIDEHRYVHGAVYEEDLRYFLFGDFGPSLMANKGIDQSLTRFIRRCPVSEATVSTEALIDSYVVAAANTGLILTLDGRYLGILDNHALLRLAAEREVASARDQNPLTFLPGNNSINRHLEELLTTANHRTLVFFDFDHFKAFNDRYGFSAGDRALLMFSELLLKFRHRNDAFVGHIGGDDFFVSMPLSEQDSLPRVRDLMDKFRHDVECLYTAEDREKDGVWAKDRYGEVRFLPLLRVSAAILPMPISRTHLSLGEIVAALAKGKRLAKQAAEGSALVYLDANPVASQLTRLAEAKLG